MPTFGTEVEYPTVQTEEEMTTFTRPSHGSHDLRSQVRDDYGGAGGWPDGTIGSDPTAGIELRSDPMSGDELRDWYREAIVELSKYRPHEPSGISANSRASTIGLHLHFSGDGYTEEKARELYRMSDEPWFKLFACSSITEQDQNTYQVFRSSYCGMSYSNTPSNDCVNRAERNADHWEWRMLEPVTPDHFDLVMTFMEILHDDGVDQARDFARALVNDLDPTLTAVKRAQAIGIDDQIEELETNDRPDVSVDRSPMGNMDQREFFRAVRSSSEAPYVHSVEYEGEQYYAMQSDNYSEADDPFEFHGVSFNHDDVLRLTDAGGDFEPIDGDTYDAVQDFAEQYRETGQDPGQTSVTDGITTSEATDALLDRLADAVNGDN